MDAVGLEKVEGKCGGKNCGRLEAKVVITVEEGYGHTNNSHIYNHNTI